VTEQYKFVEVSPVTAESLEDCVNEWVAAGWTFDGIRFVVTEHSKRPAMAFVTFTRAADGEVTEAPREPRPLVHADEPEPADAGREGSFPVVLDAEGEVE
jgi:hypothetical protein